MTDAATPKPASKVLSGSYRTTGAGIAALDLVVRELLDERDWSDARGDEIRRAGGE